MVSLDVDVIQEALSVAVVECDGTQKAFQMVSSAVGGGLEKEQRR